MLEELKRRKTVEGDAIKAQEAKFNEASKRTASQSGEDGSSCCTEPVSYKKGLPSPEVRITLARAVVAKPATCVGPADVVADASKVKAERAKAEAEVQKAKAEADIAKAAAEKAKAEAEKLLADVERARAEAEKVKSDAEKAKAEARMPEAEADIAKASEAAARCSSLPSQCVGAEEATKATSEQHVLLTSDGSGRTACYSSDVSVEEVQMCHIDPVPPAQISHLARGCVEIVCVMSKHSLNVLRSLAIGSARHDAPSTPRR
ncbi:MAG: hypothetical protein SGPRY_011336 [Prymnesium sp.]